MEIDYGNKIEIVLKNERPVELLDLTMSLIGVSHQYQRFIESEATDDYAPSTELFVKEVRTGSIIVELVAQAMPIVPLIWEGGPLNEWVKQAQAIIFWLLGKVEQPPKSMAKKDLEQWNSIIEPVAKDQGGAAKHKCQRRWKGN